jgi:bifunctional DNase/RNase
MIGRAVTTALVLLLTIFSSFDSPGGKVASSDDLIKLEVATLVLSEEDRSVVLVLRPVKEGLREEAEEARLVLPLVIGVEEARSIGVAFHKLGVPRPLSHDLMKKIIDEYGGAVVSCVITKMEQATFFAELRLKRSGREMMIDCRPSDAIGLALRTNAPVYVRRPVLLQHGIDPTKTDQPPSKPLKT